jgi:hypothetical protein
VGGEAVIYHGHARLTGDLDLFYGPSSPNTRKLYSALKEFWLGQIPEIDSQKDLLKKGVIIQFGIPPNRIDLINLITGVSFIEAWKSRVEETMKIQKQDVTINYIGLSQLIKNKKAMKRYKDLEDLKFLEAAVHKI